METSKDIAELTKTSLSLSQIGEIVKRAKDIVDYTTMLISFCKNGEVEKVCDITPAQKCVDYITVDVARIAAIANNKKELF